MAPPSKFNKSSSNEREVESNHLWIGNLSSETDESDLTGLFAKYGALDSVATYSSRNFAFVYFKRIEDAKAAKGALQGTIVRGNPIKIEFARPVCFKFCDLSNTILGLIVCLLFYSCMSVINCYNIFVIPNFTLFPLFPWEEYPGDRCSYLSSR